MKSNRLLRIVTILFASISVASAQTILVNFGSQSITNWNSMGAFNSDLGAGSVITSSGAIAAGVSITTNNFANSVNNTGTYASGGTVASWVDTTAVTTTWIRSGGTGPATVVISGLDDDITYTMDLVSARNTGTSQLGNLFVNGGASDIGVSTNYSAPAAWTSGQVLTWTAITPVSGSITLSINGIDSSNTSYLNALRLTAVPEPSVAILSAAGLGVVMIFRRRSR